MSLPHHVDSVAERLIRALIHNKGHQKIRTDLDRAVEWVYERCPSGDYGRGDIRRKALQLLAAAERTEAALSPTAPDNEAPVQRFVATIESNTATPTLSVVGYYDEPGHQIAVESMAWSDGYAPQVHVGYPVNGEALNCWSEEDAHDHPVQVLRHYWADRAFFIAEGRVTSRWTVTPAGPTDRAPALLDALRRELEQLPETPPIEAGVAATVHHGEALHEALVDFAAVCRELVEAHR